MTASTSGAWSPRTSSVDAVTGCLDRISSHDGRVHAMMTVLAETALEEAAERDRQREAGVPLGVLHGMPVIVKDNIDTAGVRTTAGSLHLADHVPAEDAEVVRRLRAAGAVLVGKAAMAEFAMGAGTAQNPHYPEVRNPWDLARIPGGSSSGSAAGVAAEMAVGALGTDTGGSVRIPAAFCGVVGIRPTRGRVPNRGSVPVSPSLDTVGTLAHHAEDAARLLAAIDGYDRADPTSARGPGDDILAELGRGVDGLTVGVPRAAFFRGLHPDVERALDDALGVLEGLGASIREVAVDGVDQMPRMTQFIRNPEAYLVHEERLARVPERFGAYVIERLASAQAMTAMDVARARAWQAGWVRQFEDLFEDVDLLVTPMVAQPPPRADDPDLNAFMASLTGPANAWVLAGVPSASVPCGLVEGLPVAMQVVGPAWHDGRVLRAAHAYQQVTDWHRRRPALLEDGGTGA